MFQLTNVDLKTTITPRSSSLYRSSWTFENLDCTPERMVNVDLVKFTKPIKLYAEMRQKSKNNRIEKNY